jgi:Zn-finger nucleic acid-binding protein
MNCPRCNIQLIPEKIRDAKFSVDADTCPQCGGTWFNKGELLKLDKIVEPTMLEIRKIPKGIIS